jgi:hypothetical protein
VLKRKRDLTQKETLEKVNFSHQWQVIIAVLALFLCTFDFSKNGDGLLSICESLKRKNLTERKIFSRIPILFTSSETLPTKSGSRYLAFSVRFCYIELPQATKEAKKFT